jgi:hypothetical protein
MIRLEVRKKSDRVSRAIATAYLDMGRNDVKEFIRSNLSTTRGYAWRKEKILEG